VLKIFILIGLIFYFVSSIGFWIYIYGKRDLGQKIGYSFFGLGFLSQILYITVKSFITKSFAIVSSEDLIFFLAFLIAMLFYLFSLKYRKQLQDFGSIIAPVIVFLTALSLQSLETNANQYNNIWFYLHIGFSILTYALILIATISAVLYILTDKDLKEKKLNSFFVVRFSSSIKLLQDIEYKSTLFAFISLSLALISSSIWTALYIGKHWIWEPKQILLSLLWLFYAFILHTRIIKHLKGRKASYLTLIGSLMAFIIFWLVRHPTF